MHMQFKPTARAVAFRSFEVNLDFDAKFRRDEPDVPDRRATDKQAKRSSGKKVAESGRPGRAELLAKKGRIVGGVGCPPKCRTSGKLREKLRGSSGKLRPFRTF